MNFRSIYFVCKENYEIINEEKYKDIRYLRSTGKEDFVHAMENLYEIEPVRETSKLSIAEEMKRLTEKKDEKEIGGQE